MHWAYAYMKNIAKFCPPRWYWYVKIWVLAHGLYDAFIHLNFVWIYRPWLSSRNLREDVRKLMWNKYPTICLRFFRYISDISNENVFWAVGCWVLVSVFNPSRSHPWFMKQGHNFWQWIIIIIRRKLYLESAHIKQNNISTKMVASLRH